MSTFTLNIVALFTIALMQLAITKCTDFLFFFLFSCCNIVERGFSFQAVFLDSLKAECCESQNCGRHYTNIMCMFVLIPLKTFREEKDQMLHHFTVTFLADTCKNYEPKKKRKRMGGSPILLIFT